MSTYATSTAPVTAVTSPIRSRPLTEEELLDREELLAVEGLRLSLSDVGQDILDVVDIPRHVRRHPVLSLLIGAGGGLLLTGPLIAFFRGQAGATMVLAALSKPVVKTLKAMLVGTVLSNLRNAARG
jgi:hypothetical protein